MLVSKKIKVNLHPRNIKYFESLGYIIPRFLDKWGRMVVIKGTKLEVNIKDLMKNSPIKVLRRCDNCGEIKKISWMNYFDRCQKCARTKYTLDNVIEIFKKENCKLLSLTYNNVYEKLEYICNCGNKSIITLSNFLNGHRCNICGLEKRIESSRKKITEEDRLRAKNEKRERTKLEQQRWKNIIKRRDNYKCQICGYQGKLLDNFMNAHHIESFLNNKELRLDINNGITFCHKCHRKFHNKYGIKNNNEKQFNEFLLIEKGV